MDKVLIIVGDAQKPSIRYTRFSEYRKTDSPPLSRAQTSDAIKWYSTKSPPGWDITEEWKGYSINADIAFRDVDHPNTSASSSLAVALPNTSATTRPHSHHALFL